MESLVFALHLELARQTSCRDTTRPGPIDRLHDPTQGSTCSTSPRESVAKVTQRSTDLPDGPAIGPSPFLLLRAELGEWPVSLCRGCGRIARRQIESRVPQQPFRARRIEWTGTER